MAIEVELVEGEDRLREFVLFQGRVYAGRSVRWPAFPDARLPFLLGRDPSAEGRHLRPLVVRRGGEIVVRACAVVDDRYRAHWGEALGHLAQFEALPDTREETRALVDAACDWLRGRGMTGVRAGFGPPPEMPFAIDEYESLPPFIVRQNPPYYHALLKDAGFETEKGWVDYKIRATPDLVDRWRSALESVRLRGYDVVPLTDVPEERRIDDFVETWNDTFSEHWGFSPFTRAEMVELFATLGPLGMFETSVIAYLDDKPAGVLWVIGDSSAIAETSPGREIRDDERLNFLGIGVREPHRGRGVNLAMAAYAYLKLVELGASYVSYTLVLDDNWPSRRTAEKLGAYVCGSYVVYRRNFASRRAPAS